MNQANSTVQDQIQALIAPVAGPEAGEEAARILEAALQAEPGRGAELALEWAGKRATGEPLALILGRQRFLGVELVASADVLAPRLETEILGREVLGVIRALAQAEPDRPLHMIDMGCGSGNLACACASAEPRMRIWASDITESCAALTLENVKRLGLEERVRVTQGDLFAPMEGQGVEEAMDIIVMNPPYIPSSSLEKTHASLLEHEPRAAFDGGPYGISILTRLMKEGPAYLKPGGHLLFEFGKGQAKLIQALLQKIPGLSLVRFAQDSEGEPRAAVVIKA
jgi:release factor glutamine methyltransferase